MSQPETRLLKPGDEAALEAFLLSRLDSSMFLLGNSRAAGLLDHGQRFQGTYLAAFEGGRMTGVAAVYWNGSLVVQAPEHADVLAQAILAESPRPILRIIGPAEQVQMVRESPSFRDAPVQIDDPERLYSLDLAALIVPQLLQSGQVTARHIEPRDLDLATEWRAGYETEELGGEDTPESRASWRKAVEDQVGRGRTWILEHEGQPVATTGFNAVIREAVQVGGVWTPPELRSRGYARCAVAASLLEARAAGIQKAILFTGETNLPAQKAYEALGFRHIGRFRMLFYKTGVGRDLASAG